MDGSSEIRMQNHELCLSLCGLGLDIVGIITTLDSQSICTILLLSNGSNAGSCLLCAIVFTEQLNKKARHESTVVGTTNNQNLNLQYRYVIIV